MKRVFAWVLGGISAFVAIYVAYAHVASWHVVGEYFQPSIMERFASETHFREVFTQYRRGDLSAQIGESGLRVTGKTSASDGTLSWLQFFSTERRLEDDAIIRMRFRVANSAAYDVTVGLQRGDNPPGARELKLGLSNHSQHPEYRLMGDITLGGERATGDRVLSDFHHRLPFEQPDQWHELLLRVSPANHTVHAIVDAVDAGSVDVEWWAGSVVRLAFGVIGREPEQPVDLTIERVSYDPFMGVPKTPSFVEKFDGKILDPERWIVKPADDTVASASVSLAKGLHLEGHALHATSGDPWLPAIRLFGQRMNLESFRLRVKFRVLKIQRARFFISMTNLLEKTPMWREFAAGVRDEPDGSGGYVSGQWSATGQLSTASFRGMDTIRDHELVLDWDAQTRLGKTSLDGNRVDTRTFDLQPLEMVEIRLGADVLAPDGAFEAVVQELQFDRR